MPNVLDISDEKHKNFCKETKRLHDSFDSFNQLVLPSLPTEVILSWADYKKVNRNIRDLVKTDCSYGNSLFGVASLTELHWGEEISETSIKGKKPELPKSIKKNKQQLLWRSLTVREHIWFDRCYPDVHRHVQVLSFGSILPHGVSEIGGLGFKSFKNDQGETELDVCYLKGEVFKNVFIPLILFEPQIGR